MRASRLARIAALLMFASLLACRSGVESRVTTAPLPVEPETHTLGQGDVFEVRVFGEEELSGTYQVTGDGSMDFPFVGQIKVEGRTPTEVAQSITDALTQGEILLDPHVSVMLTENRSKRISVIGAVAKPGTFGYTSGLTVVQAISLAGGFSSLADRDRTVVTRREGDTVRRYNIEADAMARGSKSDFLLRPGDLVFVPERIF